MCLHDHQNCEDVDGIHLSVVGRAYDTERLNDILAGARIVVVVREKHIFLWVVEVRSEVTRLMIQFDAKHPFTTNMHTIVLAPTLEQNPLRSNVGKWQSLNEDRENLLVHFDQLLCIRPNVLTRLAHSVETDEIQ